MWKRFYIQDGLANEKTTEGVVGFSNDKQNNGIGVLKYISKFTNSHPSIDIILSLIVKETNYNEAIEKMNTLDRPINSEQSAVFDYLKNEKNFKQMQDIFSNLFWVRDNCYLARETDDIVNALCSNNIGLRTQHLGVKN